MADQPVNYRKLGGPTVRSDNLMAGTASRVALYLGPDHLLLTEKLWFRESYRRFYFRDIQAFLIQKNDRWRWYGVALLTAVLLFVLVGVAAAGSNAAFFFYGLAALLAVGVAVNWLLGQTCRCFIKTAVQYEELTPLHRERKANRALALLEREIAAVQGPMPPPPGPPESGREAATATPAPPSEGSAP